MARNSGFGDPADARPPLETPAASGERLGKPEISPIETPVSAPAGHPIAVGFGRLVNLPEGFRQECSWCEAVLVEGPPGASTSHGICVECAKKFLVEWNRPINAPSSEVIR